jgi:hypothetical protein
MEETFELTMAVETTDRVATASEHNESDNDGSNDGEMGILPK